MFYLGRIPTQLVELVRLRMANIHGCAFCNRSDTIAALHAGVSQAQIDALADYETGPFTAREKAALAMADVMVSRRATKVRRIADPVGLIADVGADA